MAGEGAGVGANRVLAIAVRTATIAAPVAFGLFMFGSGFSSGGPQVASVGYQRFELPVRQLELAPGEGFSGFLRRGDLSAREVGRLRDLARPYLSAGRLDPAASARVHGWPGESPQKIELRVDGDQTLVFVITGAVWGVAVESVTVRLDTAVVTGRVAENLWAARLAGDAERLSVEGKGALVGHLAEVFAWQIDFYREVRSGDAFRLAIERELRPDGTVRAERVLAAEWRTGSVRLEAYRFSSSEERKPLYYDADGLALKGPFLRSPLDFVRVTSRFSNDRYHPILGRSRSHRGTDYGAASGTSVRATGDGTIRTAGWAGDYGLLIEVDHAGGIRTRYAHLSGIADRLVPGARVSQGERIGLVGATGLATGPHLHYEFLINGRPVNPASVDLPVERPLPSEDLDRFDRVRLDAAALLRRTRLPSLNAGLNAREADERPRTTADSG